MLQRSSKDVTRAAIEIVLPAKVGGKVFPVVAFMDGDATDLAVTEIDVHAE